MYSLLRPVRTCLIHVSDLHVGGHDERSFEEPLRQLVARNRPALIIVTGDLTHRGRSDQHERAAALLKSLGAPVLAVPGNHDIPHAVPARFVRPWSEFERHWNTTEPVFASDELVVVGLNSARPWRHQSGGLSEASLERAAAHLEAAPAEALRVACLHHHLIGAPWRSRKRPVARRARVLGTLADAGADLILAGHIHQSAVSERREFEVAIAAVQTVAIATAPGLGQPRPRRRGEARGLHVVEADEREVRIETFVYSDGAFALIAARRFPRGS